MSFETLEHGSNVAGNTGRLWGRVYRAFLANAIEQQFGKILPNGEVAVEKVWNDPVGTYLSARIYGVAEDVASLSFITPGSFDRQRRFGLSIYGYKGDPTPGIEAFVIEEGQQGEVFKEQVFDLAHDVYSRNTLRATQVIHELRVVRHFLEA